MIILIAESKTMKTSPSSLDEYGRERCYPEGLSVSEDVMRHLLELPLEEIAQGMKVSQGMAVKIHKMAYEFPLKETGTEAIEAFTGVVFKSLDYDTLSDTAKSYVNRNVRIISSLYGWLTPQDVIKPYRMEFSSRFAPGDNTFSQYWKKDVTIRLVKTVKKMIDENYIHSGDSSDTDIIDLMPGDASKCIDRKLVKRFTGIWKVDFKQLTEGGGFKTPPANRLKQLRGLLLREMAQRGINTIRELQSLATPDFIPLGTPDYPDHIAFCVE